MNRSEIGIGGLERYIFYAVVFLDLTVESFLKAFLRLYRVQVESDEFD